jgi:competence protein ComEA
MKAPDRLPTWLGYVGLSCVWLVVLAFVVLPGRRPASKPIEIVPPPGPEPTLLAPPTARAAELTATPGPLRVDVAGAVRHPAVYRLAPGSLVADAIAAAGGPAEDADLDRINKALPLDDYMQVYVPRRSAASACSVTQTAAEPPPISTAPARADKAPAVAGERGQAARINLNTATLAELDTLPGVGEATAEKIIAGRPYASVEDLLRVDGIAEAKLAKLRDLVTVE